MDNTDKFAFDVGITLVAQAINMFLAFLISVMLGRYLGAEDLGLYRMASTVYAISVLVAGVGLPVAITKYAAEYRNKQDQLNMIVSAGLITSLILGIISIPTIHLLAGPFAETFHMPKLYNLLYLIALVVPVTLVTQILLGTLNGLREMRWYALYYVLQGILMLSTTAFLLYLGFGVAGAVLSIVASSIVSFTILLMVSKRYFRPTRIGYHETIKKLVSFSAFILIANWISMVNYQADTLLIGYFLASKQVGYYGVSINLSRLLWVIPQAIQMITYPATSEFCSGNRRISLQKMFDKSMKYTSCLLSVLALTLGFFAHDIVAFIYGPNFLDSVLPLQILLIGTVIYGAEIAVGGCITGAGRPDIGPKIVGISAAINIALNLILIPSIGIIGASIATSISLVAAALLGLYLTIRVLGVSLDYGWYGKISLLIVSCIAAFTLLHSWHTYLTGAIILSFYALTLAVFMLDAEDRTYFLSLARSIRGLF